MSRPVIMYSEVLRRKPASKKTRGILPLKINESNSIKAKCPVLPTPTSSSSSDSCVDGFKFPPGLSQKLVRHDHDHNLDFSVYAELHLVSPDITSVAGVRARKASIGTVYVPPPPLAKPYVDKFLGPEKNVTPHEPGAASANLNSLPTFDPFADDTEGPTRSAPPSYRLHLSDLLPRRESESSKQAVANPPFTQTLGPPVSASAQGPDHSLRDLFLQRGVETSVYFLPPGLFDNPDEEAYPMCSKSCLMRRFPSAPPRNPQSYRDTHNRSPMSTSSNHSRSSSLVSRTDYSLSPTISSASSAYSEDYSFYHRRKPAAPKCSIVKFDSSDTIGVSLEAVLSKKNCLTDPDEEVMGDWGEKGKPASIHLIITRNGFKRVFPIPIRCSCGVITRAELAYEIADIMQRYLVEARTVKSRMDSERSISGLYLLLLRTDNQGLSWRATFADRRRIKTNDTWRKPT